MPGFFSGVTGKGSATLFEIRLENDIIVLRGDENEAASQILKGAIVLCLPHALRIEDVHLRMIGSLKVGWTDTRMTASGVSNDRVSKVSEIFSHRWAPFVGGGNGHGSSSKGTTLPAGNYEWPFELVMAGSMAESIEGLAESHITYKLKATVARGKLAYDLHAWKPVRIVRTLDPSALELAHAMTVENIWPNKIEYQLIIPQKAIVFGTAINVEMRFTSLLKGLKIGQIKCQLIEYQEFTLPGAVPHSVRQFKFQRDVGSWTFELNEEAHYHDMLDESGQDGYVLKEIMSLPKRLSKYLQDVEVHGIKIRHKVKFTIALHNPDGHVSELRATLPVTIFISPNMPLDADGALVDQTPSAAQSADMSQHAPPLYGHHMLDQLYADFDNTGFMTPAPQSGMSTPFFSQSRRGSSENLPSFEDSTHPAGAVPPAALSSRLSNLPISRNSSFLGRHPGTGSGANTPYHQPRDVDHSTANGGSSANSTPMSRRASEEDVQPSAVSNLTSGHQTPEHIDLADLGDLTKVPSYGTAVKTPVRGLSYTDAAPDYLSAVSAPPSPDRNFSSIHSSSGSRTSESSPRAERSSHSHSHMASLGFTPIHEAAADTDEARRLLILQNRDRR